jgi:hypothetical protein
MDLPDKEDRSNPRYHIIVGATGMSYRLSERDKSDNIARVSLIVFVRTDIMTSCLAARTSEFRIREDTWI